MSTPDCTTFSTLAIHAGFDPDPITGDVVPPIHVASTFVQDRPGELREGYEYGRCGNPTTNAFAGALAALEGATHGFAFPSGMSAEDTVIRLLARPVTTSCIRPTCTGAPTSFSASSSPPRASLPRPWTSPTWPRPRRDPRVAPADRVGGDALEPVPAGHGHRRNRGPHARGGRPADRGQHLRDAGPAASPRAGRGRRRALDDQVRGRPLRRGRRRLHPARWPGAARARRALLWGA